MAKENQNDIKALFGTFVFVGTPLEIMKDFIQMEHQMEDLNITEYSLELRQRIIILSMLRLVGDITQAKKTRFIPTQPMVTNWK
jgi:hypothetical protein